MRQSLLLLFLLNFLNLYSQTSNDSATLGDIGDIAFMAEVEPERSFYYSFLKDFEEEVAFWIPEYNIGDNIEKALMRDHLLVRLDYTDYLYPGSQQERKKLSLFKYWMVNGYRNIEEAILIPEDKVDNWKDRKLSDKGKQQCNPYFNFNAYEIIDGKKETLLDFYEKVTVKRGYIGDESKNLKSILLKCGCKRAENLQTTDNEELLATIKSFEHGFAVITGLNGKKGYVNTKKEIIKSPIYDDMRPFNKYGMAAVSKKNKWGAINTKGEVVIPLTNNDILLKKDNEQIHIKHKGFWKVYNHQNQPVVSHSFLSLTRQDSPYDFPNYHWVAQIQNGKWGIYNSDFSQVVVPFEHDKIKHFSKRIPGFISIKNNKVGSYNYVEQEIITPYIYDELVEGYDDDAYYFNNYFDYSKLIRLGKNYGIIDIQENLDIVFESQPLAYLKQILMANKRHSNADGNRLSNSVGETPYFLISEDGKKFQLYDMKTRKYLLNGSKFKYISSLFQPIEVAEYDNNEIYLYMVDFNNQAYLLGLDMNLIKTDLIIKTQN